MATKSDKYAVVKLSGKQYKVFEGKELLVDKIKDKKVDYNVLLLKSADVVKVGKPGLTDVKITFKVVAEEEKGEKLDVFKYKSKSRYRKHIGFRPKYTRLLVEKIA